MMKLQCFGAKYSPGEKKGEDAYAFNSDLMLFAVADGLGSQPATSGYFSQVVADWFVMAPDAVFGDIRELANAAPPESNSRPNIAAHWVEYASRNSAIMQNGIQSFAGAGCTMAAISVRYGEVDGSQNCIVKMTVVGDCAIFVLRPNGWTGMDNADKSGKIHERPPNLGQHGESTWNKLFVNFDTKRLAAPNIPNFNEIASQTLFNEGGVIILATDALASWIHCKLSENRTNPIEALGELLCIQTQSGFVEWAGRMLHEGKICSDDLTLLRIAIPPASPENDEASIGGVAVGASKLPSRNLEVEKDPGDGKCSLILEQMIAQGQKFYNIPLAAERRVFEVTSPIAFKVTRDNRVLAVGDDYRQGPSSQCISYRRIPRMTWALLAVYVLLITVFVVAICIGFLSDWAFAIKPR